MKNHLNKFIASFLAIFVCGMSLLSAKEGQNICNLDLIYNKDYNYSFPKTELEKFLSGKAFDHTKEYTNEEKIKVCEDINAIYEEILSKNPIKAPLAVISAGSPGSGKTFKMREDLSLQAKLGSSYAYICPDDVCLKKQTRTYLKDLSSDNHSLSVRQEAYNKWRPASNAANHLLLANLIRQKYAFYFGTTCSSPKTYEFFKFLKNNGYKIRVMHVSAPDSVRWDSIKERDKSFVQTTEKDVIEKGQLVPLRIEDTFLAYADEIDFYYRKGLHESAQLVATWKKEIREDDKKGVLQITDKLGYESLKNLHNKIVKDLGREDISWENTIEKASALSHS
ncbi:MAG: zeta toxin family protein [Rhabdochlamydiaceae bacterium]